MDVFEAIAGRRSIKPLDMKPDPVDRRLIERLLQAANWAPSHRHTEPWRFIVFEGESRRALADAVVSTLPQVSSPAESSKVASGDTAIQAEHPKRAATHAKFLRPPVVIAIICQPSQLPKVIAHEEVASTAIAVQNLHLAAHALGLGGFWTSGNKASHPRMATFLGIEAPAECLGFFYVGWPSVRMPQGKRGPFHDKVVWRDC